MPGEQRQLKWYRYTDNTGRFWAVQSEADWGDSVNSGLTAFNAADPAFGPQTRGHRLRKQFYVDPTTFRVVRYIVGTTAALSGLPATVSVFVPGLATAVTYNKGRAVAEVIRVPGVSNNKIDHP
jgi:hypothetical protein